MHCILFSICSIAITAVLLTGCERGGEASSAAAGPVYGDAFWTMWADGQAELSGYDLTIPRYGEPRRGTAVTVFVSETFSETLRVKADPGRHPKSDEFPVMKLNLVKDYQTGVYDYNEMTSTFVALGPAGGISSGSPVKVAFSRQEWCGLTHHQLLFYPSSVRITRHSYFDGDADGQAELAYSPSELTGDVLPLWARGMAGPALLPGESREVSFLAELASASGVQRRGDWKPAVVSRSAETQLLRVPAGEFQAELWTVRAGNDETRTFHVEKAAPHRILKWEFSGGEQAELLKSTRMKYWEMQSQADEGALSQLGLAARPPQTR